MKIAIASDHAGFALKENIKKLLEKLGYEYKDFGTYSDKRVDYPDYALKVAENISKKKYDRGILICGSGIGMCITANKVPGIRAALCNTVEMAKLSREHNDSNILTFGARMIGEDTAEDIVKVWLKTEFLGDRHLKRINKISEIEKKYNK